MGGPWDIPNTDSEPGKARWLAKGNMEEMACISDSNSHKRVTLSLSSPVCLSTRTLFPPNKHLFHYFPSLCGNSYLHSWWARTLLLPTGPWWSSGWDSALSLLQPNLSLWPGTEILFQATAGRGHPRSQRASLSGWNNDCQTGWTKFCTTSLSVSLSLLYTHIYVCSCICTYIYTQILPNIFILITYAYYNI